MNLLSEIQREEDSALTRPFTFSELESLLQNYEKVQKTYAYTFTALPVLYCLAILIVVLP